MGSGTTAGEMLRIDFSGLDVKKGVGTPEWAAVRAKVMQALETYGCFEAMHDGITPRLCDATFTETMKLAFNLPTETKSRTVGYMDRNTFEAIDSVAMLDATPDGIRSFTNLLWPQGNPNFSETMCFYANGLVELNEMVQRMIMEGLGIEKYYDSLADSTLYGLRLSSYNAPKTEDEAFPEHTDPHLLNLVCQSQVGGLEVQISGGNWIPIKPSPDSFIVLIGDSTEALTNGRLRACRHRVMMCGDETRYSTIFSSNTKDGYMIHAPEELVDEVHPALFKPYDFADFFRFRHTKEAVQAKHALKAFCGVNGDEVGI